MSVSERISEIERKISIEQRKLQSIQPEYAKIEAMFQSELQKLQQKKDRALEGHKKLEEEAKQEIAKLEAELRGLHEDAARELKGRAGKK